MVPDVLGEQICDQTLSPLFSAFFPSLPFRPALAALATMLRNAGGYPPDARHHACYQQVAAISPTLRSMFLKGEQIAKFEVILIFAIRKILA